MKNKRVFLLLYILVLILILSACAPNVKNDKEIKEDLQNHLNSVSEPYVNIEELKIVERRTDKTNKKDNVYVEIIASNDEIKCELSYIMNYTLYEQGWILDTTSRNYEGVWNIIPLKSPSIEEVKAFVNKRTKDFYTYKETFEDLANNKCIFYFINEGKVKHAKVIKTYAIPYNFDNQTGLWKNGTLNEEKEEYIWEDISGTWFPVFNQYVPSTGWYEGWKMDISDVNKNSIHVKMSKEGIVYYDNDISFVNETGAEFTVKTSDSSWDNINMIISPNAIGADDLGTRAGCYFEKK